LEKEKVVLELPKGILTWYRMKAEYLNKSVEEVLTKELIENCAADINNLELVSEVVASRILVDCWVYQDLWSLGHEIEWIKWRGEEEKHEGAE